MSRSLDDRLVDAKQELGKVVHLLSTHGSKLPIKVVEDLYFAGVFSSEVEHWRTAIEARRAARDFLSDLEKRANADDMVAFGVGATKFRYARLLGVQAYLTMNWSLADRLVAMASHVFCVRSSLNDPKGLPHLMSFFIGEHTKSKTAALVYYSLRETFGWPSAMSYALRNHFAHDGGQLNGVDFFEGTAAASAFKISDDGWDRVVKNATDKGVQMSHQRSVAAWPGVPKDDLRLVLDACEREMDDALGILVGSSCRALSAHVAFLVGEL